MMRTIASISWGKDSLAMLIELILRGIKLDEAVFYDTGMEFGAIYQMRDRALPLLRSEGIQYTELKPEYDFRYNMFERPVNGRNGFHLGYSWCGGRCRWGTTDKLRALDRYAEEHNAQMFVAIAADETKRLEKERKPYKQFPLADFGISEAECLQTCYEWEFDWRQGEIRLYDILDRVSCWCCNNKNLKELKNIYRFLPDYWELLKGLQARTDRPMKGPGKSVFELEKRFEDEIRRECGNEQLSFYTCVPTLSSIGSAEYKSL